MHVYVSLNHFAVQQELTLYINYASIKIRIKVHFEKEKAHKLIDISRLSSEECICLTMLGLPWAGQGPGRRPAQALAGE